MINDRKQYEPQFAQDMLRSIIDIVGANRNREGETYPQGGLSGSGHRFSF